MKSSPVISTQVVVHVGRLDGLAPALVVQILKELVAWQIAARLDHAREPAVVEIDLVLHAALASEREPHAAAADLDMRVPQRRQAERLVLPRVFVVADPDERLLEQLDDRGQDLVLRQSGTPQVGVGAAAHARQRLREADQAVVLRLVADLAPPRVIAILLAAARVAAGGLKMAARVGRDPDVLPCRRNHQRPDAVQLGLVAQHAASGSQIGEA